MQHRVVQMEQDATGAGQGQPQFCHDAASQRIHLLENELRYASIQISNSMNCVLFIKRS